MKNKIILSALIGLSFTSTSFAMDVIRCVNIENMVERIVAIGDEKITVRASNQETMVFNDVKYLLNVEENSSAFCPYDSKTRNYLSIRISGRRPINELSVGSSVKAEISFWQHRGVVSAQLWQETATCTVESKDFL